MKRGFTLIELTIVLAIMGICSAPLALLSMSMMRQFRALTMTASLKNEADQAGYRITRLVAGQSAWHLDADNHGVTLGDGSHVYWHSPGLILVQRGRTHSTPVPDVSDLTVVRHGKSIVVNVSVTGPVHPGGPPITSHSSYQVGP